MDADWPAPSSVEGWIFPWPGLGVDTHKKYKNKDFIIPFHTKQAPVLPAPFSVFNIISASLIHPPSSQDSQLTAPKPNICATI